MLLNEVRPRAGQHGHFGLGLPRRSKFSHVFINECKPILVLNMNETLVHTAVVPRAVCRFHFCCCANKIFVRLCVVFPPSVSHISAVNHAHERIGIMRTMI